MTYKEIIDCYYQPLYWYIRRMVVIHEDAQDVLQDTFVKIYRHLWTLRNPESARAWVYKIADNETKRFLRAKAKKLKGGDLSELMLKEIESSEYINYSEMEAIAIQKGMLRLTRLQKRVFCLRYYDGMDYEEISYITGSPVGTLKVSYHNARKIIEEYVKQQ